MTSRPSAILASYRFVFDGDGRVRFAPEGDPLGPEQRYDVEDQAIARAFGLRLSPALADLVDLGLAVYVADRLARRRPAHADLYHPHWTRRIKVRLPLRDPVRWSAPDLRGKLVELLWFLTEDLWEFDFVPRTSRLRPSETMVPLLSVALQTPVTVALFSGGLDSFAGACSELLTQSSGTFVLVSSRTNSRVGAAQALLSHELRRKTPREVLPVVVGFGLKGRNGQYDEDEWTQRSRGFIYTILGAVATQLAGATELLVYEPGIGAINLPYTEAQLGAQSTRATDPRTLLGIARLVTLATGSALVIRSPFLFATKAELVESVVRLGLGHLAKNAISCDGVPLRVKGHTHCGLCTSCILRRQALDAAGLGHLDRQSGIYLHDVWAGGIRFEKLQHFRAMDYQADQLIWAVSQPEPWRELSRMYPQLIEIADTLASPSQPASDVEGQLVSLYRRYCDEWSRFRAQLPVVLAP